MSMQKYKTIFGLFFIQGVKNYKLLIGHAIFLITCLIIFSHLWKMAALKSGGFDPLMLLWYIAFNEWVLISIPSLQEDMQEEFRTGSLVYLIARPVSYLGAKFTEGLAQLLLQLLFLGAVTFSFSYFWTGIVPLNFGYFGLMLVFGLFSGIIGLLLQMIVGLSCFWLHDVTPIGWIIDKFLFMLGGLFLPLMVYPEWLQYIASLTPFPLVLGGRSALVFDCTVFHAVKLFCHFVIWIAALTLLLQYTFRRGLKILQIEGG